MLSVRAEVELCRQQHSAVSEEMSKTAGWKEAFTSALSYETEGCQFTAALGIRRDEETEPLLPVHSKVHHDLKSTRDGFGFTRYYAAVPGHEFVVPVRLATSQKLTEYGFYVFIDKGCDPDPKDFDHFHWWGANPSKEDRILVVNGFYKSPTESRAMRFAPTHDVDNVPISSSPSYTAACASMADPRPAPRARQEDEEERQKKRNLTGWIVLRFHKVAGYKQATSGEQRRPKRARVDAEAKPALLGEVGSVIKDDGAVEYDTEPEFDPTAIFEFRIRYNHFHAISREAATKGGSSWTELESSSAFFRAIPLESLLGRTRDDKSLREYCLSRMLTRAQKIKDATAGNIAVSLVEVLRQINLHFSRTGAELLCSTAEQRQQGTDLADLAAEEIIQGEPCHVRNLEHDDDKEEEEAVIMNQRPEYERKLCNLRTLFEDQPLRYELGLQGVAAAGPSCGISPRSMTVKNASIDLDDD